VLALARSSLIVYIVRAGHRKDVYRDLQQGRCRNMGVVVVVAFLRALWAKGRLPSVF